jgi:hypothetical protein
MSTARLRWCFVHFAHKNAISDAPVGCFPADRLVEACSQLLFGMLFCLLRALGVDVAVSIARYRHHTVSSPEGTVAWGAVRCVYIVGQSDIQSRCPVLTRG